MGVVRGELQEAFAGGDGFGVAAGVGEQLDSRLVGREMVGAQAQDRFELRDRLSGAAVAGEALREGEVGLDPVGAQTGGVLRGDERLGGLAKGQRGEGEVQVRFGPRRFERDGPAVPEQRGGGVVGGQEKVAQIVGGFRVIGVKPEGVFVSLAGLGGTCELGERESCRSLLRSAVRRAVSSSSSLAIWVTMSFSWSFRV